MGYNMLKVRRTLARRMLALLNLWRNNPVGVKVFEWPEDGPKDIGTLNAFAWAERERACVEDLSCMLEAGKLSDSIKLMYRCQYCMNVYLGAEGYCCPECGEASCAGCKNRCGCNTEEAKE